MGVGEYYVDGTWVCESRERIFIKKKLSRDWRFSANVNRIFLFCLLLLWLTAPDKP